MLIFVIYCDSAKLRAEDKKILYNMHLFPVGTFKCIAVWFNTMIISFLLMQQSQLQYLNLWDLFIHIHQAAKPFITIVFSKRDIFRVILNFNAKIYCIGNLYQIYRLLPSQFKIVYSFHILLCLHNPQNSSTGTFNSQVIETHPDSNTTFYWWAIRGSC